MTTCPACRVGGETASFRRCCGVVAYVCSSCGYEHWLRPKFGAEAEKAETSSVEALRHQLRDIEPSSESMHRRISAAAWRSNWKQPDPAADARRAELLRLLKCPDTCDCCTRYAEPVRISTEHGRVDLLGVTEAFVLNDPNESAPDRRSASLVPVDPPRQPDAGNHGRSGADLSSEGDA